MPRLFSILVLFMLCAVSCARNSDGTWKAPLVYRIDVQQGNVVDQSMIDKLRPGMDKKQVKFIMGTPLITDTFHSNRWDYLYSFEPGRGEREQRRITLYFNDEKLARVEGDIQVTNKPRVEEETKKELSVAVPLENEKPGFFKRMFSWEKKNTTEVKKDDSAATETPATSTATATGAETVTSATATPTEGATTETQGQPPGESDKKTDTPSETAATTTSKNASGEQSTAGNTQEKNLLRRFWDRMTKSSIESDADKGEESEQDRRDAEVLKGTSGDIKQ